MAAPRIVTILTDFGHSGPYVAAMKGVILADAPGTVLVDLVHTISPQNVLEGAFVLASVFEDFPPGTIHLAVVDPGVGTDRRLVAVETADQWFVLPDNGLVGGVLRDREPASIRLITNPALRRRKVSNTFHGRDILAPAAAFLARGGSPAELGPATGDLVRLELFEAAEDDAGLIGEVVHRDSFGNLVTNIRAERLGAERWTATVKGTTVRAFVRTYADRPAGTLVALEGSSGWMEIAEVNGDAARRLEAGPGVTVRFSKDRKP